MNPRVRSSVLVLAALAALLVPAAGGAAPVSTAFTYQGQVLKSGSIAIGTYNLQFTLYDAVTAGTQVGVTQTVSNVALTMGMFTVPLDFGPVFDGNARWLEIAVQGPGDAVFTPLAPRQPLTATPYALHALNAAGGGLTLPFAGGSATPGGASFGVTNSATTGTSPGITGRTLSDGLYAPGVLGEALSTTGSVIGVLGKALGGAGGIGVEGDGSYVGVYGDGGTYGLSGVGGTYGAYGSSNLGKGVYGTSTWGIGAQGVSNHDTGVHGSSLQGWGVYGTSSGAGKAGVFGQCTIANAVGVLGRSESPGYNAQAVYGYASQNATGVMGISEGNNGMEGGSNAAGRSGVLGWATQATGFGGYFYNSAPGGVALKSDGLCQVKTLQILGGADLAERFEGDATAEPGTVMAIDAAGAGRLAVCDAAYCTRVAGVVSGANDLSAGVTLGDHPDPARTVALALSGRVWVRCDASDAPIRPGDLLTTAARPGHAMRALDRERTPGAVLGKAMTALETGTGLVLVLVSLQ